MTGACGPNNLGGSTTGRTTVAALGTLLARTRECWARHAWLLCLIRPVRLSPVTRHRVELHPGRATRRQSLPRDYCSH